MQSESKMLQRGVANEQWIASIPQRAHLDPEQLFITPKKGIRKYLVDGVGVIVESINRSELPIPHLLNLKMEGF